jgi:uncharacterized RDD family membrane protein YckC
MDQNVLCTQCGAQSPAGAGFCQKCGARMSGLVTSPATSVAYAPAPAYTVQPFAGFWIRVLATLIDSFALSIVLTPLFLIFMAPLIVQIMRQAQAGNTNPDVSPAMLGPIFAIIPIVFAVQWLYEALLTSSRWQGTLGKKVLNLRVTDMAGNRISFGRATGRYFGKILSHMTMYIGYIMVAFTERKQGLHDLIAGTQVLRY